MKETAMDGPLLFGTKLLSLLLPALLLCFLAACPRAVEEAPKKTVVKEEKSPVIKTLPGQVPDTLDLNVNAEYALNALGGTLDEKNNYETLFFGRLVPPSMRHDGISFASSGPKYTESFVMTRWMTGSGTNEEAEKGMNAYLESCLGNDGLFYSKIDKDRPWDKTSPEDYANIYGQARTLRSMLAVSQVDDDPVWNKRMKKLVTTLKKIAIRKDDYVYYPTTPGYGDIFSYPRSGWKKTSLLTGAQRHMADLPDHSFGIPLYLGGLLTPLVQYAERTGDKDTLAFAGKLATFLLRPESGWKPDAVPTGVVPEEHGWFYGHFHAHTMCLRGLLDYAIATNDAKLKNLVRDGYQFARTFGIARLGWFQEYTGKASHETCGLANMIALAIKMSRAGLGDYWDDVDGYLRNHLVAAQITDIKPAVKVNKKLSEKKMKLLQRMRGCFGGWGSPESVQPGLMNCCLANGSQALYYGWEAIVDADDGHAVVNLLLNRAAPSVEVESYLPYEGKVVVRNKTASRLSVRIPSWVDRATLKATIGRRKAPTHWAGGYLLFDGMAKGDVLTITFPMVTRTETYKVRDFGHRGTKLLKATTYRITFKGNTAIDIAPRNPKAVFPIYQRKRLKANKTPMKPRPVYVAPKELDW